MKITEGIDFYFDEYHRMVLTAHYLLARGYCCGNGCLHCPYDYEGMSASERAARRKQCRQDRLNRSDESDGTHL